MFKPPTTELDGITRFYCINNNRGVKIIIVLKGKLKSTRGLLVYLVVIIVLYKILNCLNFNFITYLLKNLNN
jgi:hypothetical protein